MSEVPFLPEVYFHQSVQFFCIITTTEGAIVCTNSLVRQRLDVGSLHLPEAIALLYQPAANSAPFQQTLSHRDQSGARCSVSWEVTPLQGPGGQTFYRWLAAGAATESPSPEAARVNNYPEIPGTHKGEEEALRKSEQFYRNLFTDSLNGMLLMNASGTISYGSLSVESILGYNLEKDVIGRNGFEFVHPDDRGEALKAFHLEVAEVPEEKFIVIRLLRKSGEWLWCMVRGHNLLQNPHVGQIVIYFHDDTPRKQAIDALEESEQRFRTLVRDLQVGVLLQDREGRIIMCNEVILKMAGVQEEGIKNRFFWDVFQDMVYEDGTPMSESDRPIYKAIRTGKPVKGVVLGLRRKNRGERIWLIVNADPVLDNAGNIRHMVTSLTDITERKKLEEKLLAEQVSRQKLLIQATIDGQEKERKEIGKDLHDNIGQQLTTIKLYLDLAGSTADPAARELIRSATQSVSNVINEIRNISRSLVPSTLGDLGLIDSVNELLESISRAHPVNFRFHCFDFNEKDLPENKKLMLFRILQEQLTNVIRHADASMVIITLKRSSTGVDLVIDDDGRGFDVELPRKGIGLDNIRNRVELLYGHMEIVSAPGKGCSVRVRVPFALQKVAKER